ncbi:MAG TPA: hypothetical protein VFX59_18040 [Polyangiales bacterium]|nr:hypothetical protein [Polyangiales bacterium]
MDASLDAAAKDAATTDPSAQDAGAHDAEASTPIDAGPPVRYAEVAPIFAKHCVSCHAPGGDGPFSLDDYEDASDVAGLAAAAASARIMPPCATSDVSCGPTTAELATLLAWAQQDAPP